jgi:CheY-like chemotaxis protein
MMAMDVGKNPEAATPSNRPEQAERGRAGGGALLLLVDDDPLRRAQLAGSLLRAGVISAMGASASEFDSIASTLEPDVVVSVLNAHQEIPLEVLDMLDRNPRATGILVGTEGIEEVRGPLPTAPERLRTVGAGLPPDTLAWSIGACCPALGVAGPFAPAEYVQLAGLGSHSVTLHCIDARGQRLGAIVMREGHVHSACCGDFRGFDAFAAMVTRFDARVVLGQGDSDEVDADLAAHWQVLLLEAMRRSDERERRPSFSATPRPTKRDSSRSEAISEPPLQSRPRALARAASIPMLPVTEMRETLGSTRGTTSEEARALVEEGVRAVIEQDYPRAIQSFERALVADPKNTSVRHRLARLNAIVSEKR